MKIKMKLFLVNVTLVITLFASITYLLVERSSDTILGNVKQNAFVTLSQISQNLDQKLASYERIADTLYLNVQLQNALLAGYADYREAYHAYFDILRPYVSTLRTAQDIRNVVFYTPNPTFNFSNVYLLNEQVKSENEWLTALMKTPSGSMWTRSGKVQYIQTEPVFSLKQRLNYVDTDSELAVSIEVNKQVLYNLINQESKDKRIIITLPGGEVLLDSHEAHDSAFLYDYPFYEQLASNGSFGEFQYTSAEDTYIVFHQTLQSRSVIRDMKVVMLVSVKELFPEIERTRNLALLLLGVSCIVAALLIYAFASGMMNRLVELSKRMKEVQQDHNFSVHIDVQGRDEISQLGNIFNRMMRHLDELIHEVYRGEINRKELELRIKEAELYALQAQINPHFLYNVLNSIRGNLLERSDVRNAEIIHLLAKSFRILLKSRNAIVALHEEVELVSIYLRIQEYRYDGRLHVQLDIPENLTQTLVPAMSLQPIAENAIKHVLEHSAEQTRIRIWAEECNEAIHIIVEDNGQGIADDRLAEIQKWLSDMKFEPREAHFGLWNVHQRLLKTFGTQSGLMIESSSLGTRVIIVIPRHREGGLSDV
jgi:two-component system sensor histidine kinase YesM